MFILIKGEFMHFVIAVFFYFLFYNFALIMNYLQFSIHHIFMYIVLLSLFHFFPLKNKEEIECFDSLFALLASLLMLYIEHYLSISLFLYLFMMHFICAESFSYTRFYIRK